MLFDIAPDHDAGYTHAYFPVYAFDRVEFRGGSWVFAERERAYAALYAAGGLEPTLSGINRGRELVSSGRRNVWLVRAADAGEFASFEQFMDSMLAMPCEVATETLQVQLTDARYGEVRFGWDTALTVGGEAVQVGGCGAEGRIIRKAREGMCK
jgi:hypothetical protein